MTTDGIFWALAGTAAAVGALHSIAPDHWVVTGVAVAALGW
jgi:hypothetical protein